MEETLLVRARSIPAEPKTAWDYFCMQRMQEISHAAQGSGDFLSEGIIRHQLAEEWNAVPESQRQALDQQGLQDLHNLMQAFIHELNHVRLLDVLVLRHQFCLQLPVITATHSFFCK
jgi:hypothetical protein